MSVGWLHGFWLVGCLVGWLLKSDHAGSSLRSAAGAENKYYWGAPQKQGAPKPAEETEPEAGVPRRRTFGRILAQVFWLNAIWLGRGIVSRYVIMYWCIMSFQSWRLYAIIYLVRDHPFGGGGGRVVPTPGDAVF